MRIIYELRNLPRPCVLEYLQEAGAEEVMDRPNEILRFTGDGWSASLTVMEPAKVGSLYIPRELLVIEGDDEVVVERVSAFMRQKTMRGGG
ncbi:MAG: hypothetical protein JXA10_04285 [Anaerolineae bacterium]|nr:hypothetical protein [Anaerolineae bacterium]